jgi:hypothetical protein
VILTRYRAEERWHPRRTTPGAGVLVLLDNAVAARLHPARALKALVRVVGGQTPVLVGPRGDADATAAAILRRLG